MGKTSTSYRYLVPRPESSYRQLFIKGTKIRADTVYSAHVSVENPQTAEEIAADCNLPIEAVEEAIAYCLTNPPEIAQDHAREERIMAACGISEPDYKYRPYPKPTPPGLYRP